MPIPGVDNEFEVEQLGKKVKYSFDDVILSLTFIKVYLIAKPFKFYVYWTKLKSLAYFKIHNIDFCNLFALKCQVISNPFMLTSILLFTSVIIFGISIRIFERSYAGSQFDYT